MSNFFKAKNSQYLGKKWIKTFGTWSTPPPPPPFNVQKVVKIGESKTTSKLLDSGWTPPPFGNCQKERRFFFWWLPLLSPITLKTNLVSESIDFQSQTIFKENKLKSFFFGITFTTAISLTLLVYYNGWLVVLFVVWFVGWLVGWLNGWIFGWLISKLDSWLAGSFK